jgi:iron-sulfur cluster repair protein YtfE (RIC family)
MKIFDFLKKDHKKVNSLFAKIEDTTARAVKTREKLFNQLKEELQVHTEVEERVFYPALQEYDETRELIKESREEHQKVEQILRKLEPVDRSSRDFRNLIAELKNAVKHHINEEETELFPKASAVLDEDQVEQLGAQAEDEKEEIMAFS